MITNQVTTAPCTDCVQVRCPTLKQSRRIMSRMQGVSNMYDGVPEVSGSVKVWNRIGKATGADAISLRILEFGPGASPEFSNRECDEVLYVLEGSCTVIIDDNAYEVGSETGIYVRPGQTFKVENPGPDAVQIVSSQCP